MLSERLGLWNFWFMLVGVNLTFGPMHIVGLMGQPRRMYLYAGNMGFTFWNFVETIGAFILAVGVLLFLVNAAITARKPRNAPLDPWDARCYEWMTTSPPKPHNFDAIPTVHTIDEFFHRKYEEDDDGNLQPGAHRRGDPRRPGGATPTSTSTCRRRRTGRSCVAAGLPIIGIGLIFSYPVAVVGLVVVLLGGCYGWALEPSVAAGRARRRPPRRPQGAEHRWLTPPSPT